MISTPKRLPKSPVARPYQIPLRSEYMNQRMINFHVSLGAAPRQQYCNAINSPDVSIPPRSAVRGQSVSHVLETYANNLSRISLAYLAPEGDFPSLAIQRMKCGSLAFCGPILYYQDAAVAHAVRVSPDETILMLRRAYRSERGWVNHVDNLMRRVYNQQGRVNRGEAKAPYNNRLLVHNTHNLSCLYSEGNLEDLATRVNATVTAIVKLLQQARAGEANIHLRINLRNHLDIARSYWRILKHALDLRAEALESRLEAADTYDLPKDIAAHIATAEATMLYVPPPLLEHELTDPATADERIAALLHAEAIIALESN